MKKFIAIISALVLFVSLSAQDLSLTPTQREGTLSAANGKLSAADTISSNGTNSWVVQIESAWPFYYELAVDADSVAAPSVTFILQESINNVVYTNVDTVTWAGSADDTTFSFTQKTTSRKAKYVRLHGTDTGKSILKRLDFQFWMVE